MVLEMPRRRRTSHS